MAADLSIDPRDAAVVGLDLQAGVVSVYVKDSAFTARVARVMARARSAGIPVVHVKVAFRPGVPEANARNVFLSTVKQSPPHQRFFEGESGAIHPEIAPAPGDLVVTKSRVSAFAGSDLELLLRASDRHTLIVFGIATSGAVLATVAHAADMDYRVIVVSDCCADLDDSLHGVLIEKLFPRQATVIDAERFEELFASS